MFETLRDEVSRRQIPAAAVSLPGDDAPAMEGALRLRQSDAQNEWLFETVDYGTAFLLAFAASEDDAGQLLLDYLDKPLPDVAVFSQADVEQAVGEATTHWSDLRARATDGSLLIDVPAGVVFDRIGALDGTMLFPYGTSYEARSLPPFGALPAGSDRHAFVTRGTMRVRVDVVRPWFGQPGGGLRCTLAHDFVGIRDLVAHGTLERFRVDN
ncbi:TNT domain-containing protein [Microbacterium halophytorum]|uniref:TNT domain-containing protein n=1 Tax=Microbacterium halophytorum TaxID=2067568 RepID=UPI000CFC37CF|nr:TNT domain-containing protein [Microbacterium halophytorum]